MPKTVPFTTSCSERPCLLVVVGYYTCCRAHAQHCLLVVGDYTCCRAHAEHCLLVVGDCTCCGAYAEHCGLKPLLAQLWPLW